MATTSAPSTPDTVPRRRPAHRILRLAAAALAALLAFAAGVSALIGVATLTTRPGVFLAAGFAAYLVVASAALWLLTRGAGAQQRRRARAAGTAIIVAAALLPALGWLLPPGAPTHAAPAPPPGTTYWDLPTGSRIAALRTPAAGTAKPVPIVFLHGGPGVSDLAHDAEYFGRFAADGYDVWVYDQAGSGFSGRLADPSGYSLSRDLADLEEVRRHIGADRMILIGFSYGATLAANYTARHPDRVQRLVLASPGRLSPRAGDLAGTGMLGMLTFRQQLSVARHLLAPRSYLAWTLAGVSPRAAHRFAGDAELDVRFAELTRASAPGMVCPSSQPPPIPQRLGFYANRIPQTRPSDEPDITPTLRTLPIPVLVTKGSCDYLPWSFGTEARDSFPDASLVYLEGTGHYGYWEQPGRFAEVVRAFLTDRPAPVPAYQGSAVPDDYRGPRG